MGRQAARRRSGAAERKNGGRGKSGRTERRKQERGEETARRIGSLNLAVGRKSANRRYSWHAVFSVAYRVFNRALSVPTCFPTHDFASFRFPPGAVCLSVHSFAARMKKRKVRRLFSRCIDCNNSHRYRHCPSTNSSFDAGEFDSPVAKGEAKEIERVTFATVHGRLRHSRRGQLWR